MPVHNGARFLRQSLQSLLQQDFTDFELIILDNASTDTTESICREYAARDKRIRYHRHATNIGPTANFNRVVELASGRYFMWAAADDYWQPTYVASCLGVLSASDSIVLAGTMGTLVDAETDGVHLTDSGFSTVGLGPCDRFKRYKSTIHKGDHVGMIFYGIYKRSELARVLPMPNIIGSDHVLLAKLCFLGEFATVPKVLMAKRAGGISQSYQSIAGALSLKGRLLTRAPMLVREWSLQSSILRARHVTSRDKAALSWWSLKDYVRVHALMDLRNALPFAARRAANRVRALGHRPQRAPQ